MLWLALTAAGVALWLAADSRRALRDASGLAGRASDLTETVQGSIARATCRLAGVRERLAKLQTEMVRRPEAWTRPEPPPGSILGPRRLDPDKPAS